MTSWPASNSTNRQPEPRRQPDPHGLTGETTYALRAFAGDEAAQHQARAFADTGWTAAGPELVATVTAAMQPPTSLPTAEGACRVH